MRKKWVFAAYNKDRVASLAEECGISAFTALLLCAGGADTAEAVRAFFDDAALPADPFSLVDMQKAVDCILLAIDGGKRICVYGDYDADGVSATALLYSYLDAVGADVTYYIPSRLAEGYGMHDESVKKLAADGVELIITVDTGVSALEQAHLIAELGMTLVVTDHHKPAVTLPIASAVVDPCREDDRSGLSYLAGVGVAFELVCALEGGCSDELLREYTQYVALGTIADVMQLQGENRMLVIRGLAEMNQSPLPGIRALAQASGLDGKELNANRVAFGLAPRINAAGRMGDARSALQLLLSTGTQSAEYYAEELNRLNAQRHEAEDAITEDIARFFAQNPERTKDGVLVVSGKGWHEGVIGIAASKIADKYDRSAVVIAEGENGAAKGSCRGIADFSIYDAICFAGELLTNYGGHTSAAGIGLLCENIDLFRKKINAYFARHPVGCGTLPICCKLNPAGVSLSLLDALEQMEPYGAGNPKPVFAFCGMELAAVQSIGNGKHTRMKFRRKDATLQAVLFGAAPSELPFRIGDTVDLAAVVERNEYNGSVSPSVQIKSMRFAGTDDEKMFASYNIFRKIETGIRLSERERALALPDRSLIGNVYRYIKSHAGAESCEEAILKRLGCADADFCRIAVAVTALADGGLIQPDSGGWRIVDGAPKADLTRIPILKNLGYAG